MEVASIVASVVSTILAMVAIAMSVFFYTQAKNSESRVNCALEGIRTQTDALQKLTGRWMDRLTKYVTTAHGPQTESQYLLISAIKDLPRDIASQLPIPSSTSQRQDLVREAISGYCALYYYTAVTNFWAQLSLPAAKEDLDPDSQSGQFIRASVDQSFNVFTAMARILDQTDQTLLAANPLRHLADRARDHYRNIFGDVETVYARRAACPATQQQPEDDIEQENPADS